MKKEETPQDNISMYKGEKKALYASGEGKFEITQSSGWSVEEMATLQAVKEFERLEGEAYDAFIKGKESPLGVWMYRRRMSLATLSDCTGFWQWTIKRHLKPTVFGNLNGKKIQHYCDILDVTLQDLMNPVKVQ